MGGATEKKQGAGGVSRPGDTLQRAPGIWCSNPYLKHSHAKTPTTRLPHPACAVRAADPNTPPLRNAARSSRSAATLARSAHEVRASGAHEETRRRDVGR